MKDISSLIIEVVEAADLEVNKCIKDYNFSDADRIYPTVTINPCGKVFQTWVTVTDVESPVNRGTKDFAEESTIELSLQALSCMIKEDYSINKQIYAATLALINAAERYRK